MDILTRPRLRHCTLIDAPETSQTTLVVGRDYFQLERTAGVRDDLLRLKSLLDGRHTIEEICRRTGLGTSNVIDVVGAFSEAGLLQSRTAEEEISAQVFKTRVEESSLMWRRQIGLHRLFGGLSAGSFRREVFIGLLLETYHYVYMLPRTLKAIAGSLDGSPYCDVVLHYAEEEMDHYLSYQPALSEIDVIGPYLKDAHPTVGTLSLIRNFESIGRRSPLSLVCCLQLIEARPSEMANAECHLTEIAEKYGMADAVVPYIEHMKADIEFGHSDLLSTALKDISVISVSDAHTAVNDMHDLKHCFDVFHDSVVAYYEDISNYIPRPKVDFFAL